MILVLCGSGAQIRAEESAERAETRTELEAQAFREELEAGGDSMSLVLRDFRARLLTDNVDSFHASVEAFDLARAGHRAGLATFIWDADVAGRAQAMAMIEAARRGVRVVALMDALNLGGGEQLRMFRAMAREGVEVYLFRPITHAWFGAIRRMHDKAIFAEAEGETIFIQDGRNRSEDYNLGHELFDVGVRLRLSRDQGNLLYRRQFEAFVRSTAMVRLEATRRDHSDADHVSELIEMERSLEISRYIFQVQRNLVHRHAEVAVPWGMYLRNRPGRPTLRNVAERAMEIARRSIRLASAYFVPERRMVDILERQLRSGVEVQALTNSYDSTHRVIVIRHMQALLRPALDLGLRLHMRLPGEMHAKSLVIDSRFAFVKADNYDPRAKYMDTQNGIVMDSPEIARAIETTFQRELELGHFFQATPQYFGWRPLDWCYRLLTRPIFHHL